MIKAPLQVTQGHLVCLQITEAAFQVSREFVGWHAAVLAALRERYSGLVGVPIAQSDATLKEVPVRSFPPQIWSLTPALLLLVPIAWGDAEGGFSISENTRQRASC